MSKAANDILGDYFLLHSSDFDVIETFLRHRTDCSFLISCVMEYAQDYATFKKLLQGCKNTEQFVIKATQLSLERNDSRYLDLILIEERKREKCIFFSHNLFNALCCKERTDKELVFFLKRACEKGICFNTEETHVKYCHQHGISFALLTESGTPLDVIRSHPKGKEWFESTDV